MKRLLQRIKKLLSKKEKSTWAKGSYSTIKGGLIMHSGEIRPNPCEKCKNYASIEPEREIGGCPI